jgi:hypothetical protein
VDALLDGGPALLYAGPALLYAVPALLYAGPALLYAVSVVNVIPLACHPFPPPPTPPMSCSFFYDHRPGRTGDAVRGTGDAVRGTCDAVRGTCDAVRGTGGSGRGTGRGTGHGTGRGTGDKSRTSLAPESGRISILFFVLPDPDTLVRGTDPDSTLSS